MQITAADIAKVLRDPEFWSVVESAFTVTAIIVGAFWTYVLFVQRRQRFPRARVVHTVNSWELENGSLFIRVSIHVENKGDVLLRLGAGRVWLSGVRPWPPEVLAENSRTRTALSRSQSEIAWPLIGECEWDEGVEEVEPNEEEQLHFDFLVAEDWHIVQVYSYFENASKKRRRFRRRQPVGWNATTIHELSRDTAMAEKKTIGPGETKQAPPKQRPPSRPPIFEQAPPKGKPAPYVPKNPTPKK